MRARVSADASESMLEGPMECSNACVSAFLSAVVNILARIRVKDGISVAVGVGITYRVYHGEDVCANLPEDIYINTTAYTHSRITVNDVMNDSFYVSCSLREQNATKSGSHSA